MVATGRCLESDAIESSVSGLGIEQNRTELSRRYNGEDTRGIVYETNLEEMKVCETVRAI
jgi:hypothetical protein